MFHACPCSFHPFFLLLVLALHRNCCYWLPIFVHIWSMSAVNKLNEKYQNGSVRWARMVPHCHISLLYKSKYHLYRFTGRKNFFRPRSLPKWRITTIITNSFGSAQQIYCCHTHCTLKPSHAAEQLQVAKWPSAAKCDVCLLSIRHLTHSFFVCFVGLIYLVNCLMYSNQLEREEEIQPREGRFGACIRRV